VVMLIVLMDRQYGQGEDLYLRSHKTGKTGITLELDILHLYLTNAY
jgi:hypothetical protein